MLERERVSEVFARHLAVYLGQRTAPIALKTFAKQATGLAPEQVQLADVPKLLEAMRPMLNTLLGKDHTEELAQLIRRDLGIQV